MDTYAFIGARYFGGQSIWKWSSGEAMDYTNWGSGEPKTGKPCAYMNVNTGKWASESCNAGSTAFICQKSGEFNI